MSYRKLNAHPLNSLLRSTFARAAAGALGAAAPLAVLANPTGGQVVGGTATIGSAGANGVVINQGSQKAIINWQQFSVGSNEYVQFIQPNSSSVVLNRVIGSNPSNIFGNIIANGQVFLVNANGVYFAPGASVDVQGLVASTLDLNDADFMAGRYVFSKVAGAPDAGVVNDAAIHAGPGGYVVLAGDYAQNGGAIVAQTGRVYLAAGNAATLTFDNNGLISYVVDGKTLSRLAGVSNTGVIAANGGLVVMTADVANTLTATAVNNSGLITAHSVSQEGGEIVLSAQGGGDIQNSGTLDASGLGSGVAGGTIVIHGDGHTQLTDTSVITTEGDGAKGGFVDLSGHTLSVHGDVTTGKGGMLLIDPALINIVSGNVNGASTGATNSVGTGFIAGKLNAGSNVAIVASNQIKHVSGTAITATGAGNLTIEIGTVSCPTGICVGTTLPTITPGGGTIDLTGLTINIAGGFTAHAGNSSGNNGHVTLGNVTASNISVTGEYINVGNLHATGVGGISIRAVGSSDDGGSVFGGVMTADNGPVTIVQLGGHTGISIGGISAKGNVDLDDASSRGQLNIAVNGNVTGKAVTLWAEDGNVNVIGNVKGTNGDVTLRATAGGANTHSGGNVHVTGNISALQHGNVIIDATGGGSSTEGGTGGGNINVGNITAAGGVFISASYTKTGLPFLVKTGSITAGTSGASHGAISIRITGNDAVLKTGALLAQGSRTAPCSCEGAPVRAGDVFVEIEGNNGGGSVTVASAKSNHGFVSISDAGAPVTVSGDITAASNVSLIGRTLNFGNITAVGQSVNIDAATSSSINHAAITQRTGTTVTARFINVDFNASYGGVVTLANLTASSANHRAGITIDARSTNAGNSIVINGNITVNGKGSNGGFTSGMPGLGVPVAAFLDITASGSNAAAHTVKVNGNINVTGHAGAFNFTHEIESCGECGIQTLSGTGGEGVVSIRTTGTQASAQLNGVTTVKGTDAELLVLSDTIKTGAITVAGSGHTLAINANPNGHSFASNNNAGDAIVQLRGNGSAETGPAATSIVTGNVTATGKGSATVVMQGHSITAGNISVTASAASGTRRVHGSNTGSSGFAHTPLDVDVPGLFGFRMTNGTYTAGTARVFLGSSQGSSHSQPTPAQTVKVGSVAVKGVGEADVKISAKNITAGSLNATAAAGTMKGSIAGSGEGATTTHFNIVGGEADIDLTTGTGTGTIITINGGVAASGPTASVNIFGQTIKVTKGISATGHAGGKGIISGSGGGFTSAVTAPGPMTGITLSGVGSTNAASINVGGVVSAKGPGLIGIAITAAKVTLGGISASASNAAAYKLVNTGDGINDNFTAGSVAVVVFDESGGAITGPAKINGNVTINAPKGNVAFLSQLSVTGKVTITGQNIDTTNSTIIGRISDLNSVTGGGGSGGPNISSIGAVVPKINATGISMTATAGSIDLTGATLTTPTTGAVTLKATKDIILSGVTINVGTLSANAGSTIHNGGATGTITANGLALTAGKNINLSSTQITVGNGSVASLASDPTLLQALAAAGLSPSTPKPNAYFNAGGTLTLGKLTLTGNYMYLQGANIALLGPVSAPADSVIQLAPTTGAATIGVEGQPGTGSVLNLSNSLLLSLFPGTTLVIGNGAETGAVTLGSSGPFDIGSSNLIIDTTGTVTGLDNVTSTGLISTVESLLASALAPPTPSEIDPNSTNNNNAAGKHHAPGSEDPNAGTTGGTISQSTDAGGACH